MKQNEDLKYKWIVFFLMILLFASLLFLKLETDKRDTIIKEQQKTIEVLLSDELMDCQLINEANEMMKKLRESK